MSTATPATATGRRLPDDAGRGWRPGQRAVDILTDPFTQILYRARAVVIGDGYDTWPHRHRGMCEDCTCVIIRQRKVRTIWIT